MAAKILTMDEAAKAMKVELIANGKGSQAVHEAVVALRANRRAGTHSVKTKATVQKSGAKPWRQKGTGRARAGYVASPIWRGGGVVFGPHPRDYSKKVNRKARQLALRKALSSRIAAGDVVLVADTKMETHRTKDFVAWLGRHGVAGSALVVDTQIDPNMKLASRNVPKTGAAPADVVNAEDILRYGKIVVTEAALAKVGERLA